MPHSQKKHTTDYLVNARISPTQRNLLELSSVQLWTLETLIINKHVFIQNMHAYFRELCIILIVTSLY